MSDAKDLAQANQWCHAARELLGKKKGKSKALKGAKAQIKDADDKTDKLLTQLVRLNDLAYRRLSTEYKQIAGKVEVATHGGTINERGLVEAGNLLAALNTRIQQAIDTETQLAKDILKFEGAYTKLEPLVASAGALRGANMPGGAVRLALDVVDQHMEEAWKLREEAQAQHAPAKLVDANNMLTAVNNGLEDAKAKSKLADKEAADDLKFIGEWARTKPLIEQAIAELKRLPGAETSLQALQDKLNAALALFVDHNGVKQGYKAAVAALDGFDAVRKKGVADSETFRNKDLPVEVSMASGKVAKALEEHKKLAPPYASQALSQQQQAGENLGRRDAVKAKEQLDTLAQQVIDETAQLAKDKLAAETAASTLADLIGLLKSKGAPQILLQNAQNSLDTVKATDMVDCQWASAARRLGAAATTLQKLQGDFTTHGVDWERKRGELAAIRKLAVQAMDFPALLPFGQRLRDTAEEVKKPFDRFELAKSITAFDTTTLPVPKGGRSEQMTLTAAHAELKEQIRAGGLPAEDDGKRQVFVAQLKYGANIVNGARVDAESRLRTYADSLSKEDPKQVSLLQASFAGGIDDILDAWRDARGKAADAKAVEAAAEAAVKAFRKFVEDETARKAGPLRRHLIKLTQDDAAEKNKSAPARMLKTLAMLKSRGIDVSEEEGLVKAQENTPQKDYRDAYAKLQIKWDAYQLKQRQGRAKLRQEISRDIDQVRIDLPISKVLKKELEQSSTDVKLMVETQDPDLLEVAQGMKDRLKTQFDAINANPKLHEKNKQALDALSSRIGELLDKLPDTNRRLRTRLDDERVQAKHSLPSAMEARIKLLTKEVERGEQELVDLAAAVEKYRELKAEVRAAFDQMKKATATRVTEKSDAFEAWYEARIEEAKALKGKQGRIPDAMIILKDLKAKLASINTAENPRAMLRTLDAAEVQNQRTMVDLAQQWTKDVAFFLDVTLATAKKANAEQGGDSTTITGLEDLVGAAGKLLGPYLKELTTLKIGAVKGPDIKKVQADFIQARQMLSNAQNAALRLTQTPQSTNVQGPAKDGLPKLLRKWSENTQAYATTLREVANDIRAAAKDDAEPLKGNAEKVAGLVDALIPLFRAEAFATSFGVLMLDPSQVDKGQRDALAKRQLAAREQALRVMRQSRNDLAHPLLRRLTDAAVNPFDAVDVTVALSGLSTTLKEIELQALASA